MKHHPVDDNLRLVLIEEEGEFIQRKLYECRLSLTYAGGWLAGYVFLLLAIPMLHKLLAEVQTILFIGFSIATVVSFTVALLSLGTIYQLIKYLKYRKNYRKFRRRYNRTISHVF